jgi:DNA-directed RNA polymerase subunit RPC12/RpoP
VITKEKVCDLGSEWYLIRDGKEVVGHVYLPEKFATKLVESLNRIVWNAPKEKTLPELDNVRGTVIWRCKKCGRMHGRDLWESKDEHDVVSCEHCGRRYILGMESKVIFFPVDGE